MLSLFTVTVFFFGVFFGFLLAFLFNRKLREKSFKFATELASDNKEQQRVLFDSYLCDLKSSFREQSLDNLQRSTETTFKLTSEQLENNKNSIREELSTSRSQIEKNITDMLQKVTDLGKLIHVMEEKTGQNYGQLGALLKQTNEQTKDLISTTSSIRDVLSNSQNRGLWGEKIAEDILKHSGLIENIHYKKQVTLESGSRPDFTFLLPQDLKLHMDVKFPLENYKNYVKSSEGQDKKKYEKLFISDIKNTVKSLLTRSYIDPNSTVGCVLLFIPHEQILSFVQENKPELLDECLKNHIILCSPMSLLSVLMVVKKAVETFRIQKTSQEILAYMNTFKKQWGFYNKSFETLGRRIKDLDLEYDKLTTTRTKQLTNIVDKIANLSPVEKNQEEDKVEV